MRLEEKTTDRGFHPSVAAFCSATPPPLALFRAHAAARSHAPRAVPRALHSTERRDRSNAASLMVAFLPVAGAGKVAGARVHPVVVFNACDSFVRRAEAQDRVIGTLLGSVGVDGVVDVRNCYAVPHNEQNDTVYVDVEFHRAMIELHQKVNPSEKIVGWYSTGDGVVPTDALIHEFYSHECQNPVHVTLDVGFNDRAKLMRAWTGSSIAIGAQARRERSIDRSPLSRSRVDRSVDSFRSDRPTRFHRRRPALAMKRFLSNRRLTRRSLLFAKTSSLLVPPGEIGGGRRGGQGCRGGGDRGEEGDRAGRGRRRRRGDGARRRRLRVRREAARGDPLPRDQSYKRLRRGGARGRSEALRAVLGRVHVRRRQRRGRLTEDRREAVRDARRRGEARRGGVVRPYTGPHTTASAW